MFQTASPDSVKILDSNNQLVIDYKYRDKNCSPIPFAIDNYGRLYVGHIAQGHGELSKECREKYPNFDGFREKGRLWDNRFITVWYYCTIEIGNEGSIAKDRQFYKKLAEMFKQQADMDINDYIILIEVRKGWELQYIGAVRLADYVAGKNPVPYEQFMSGEKKIDLSEPFKPTDGTPDMPRTRLDRERLWKYGWVAENKELRKSIRNVIQKHINEDYSYSSSGSRYSRCSHCSPDDISIVDDNGNEVLKCWYDDYDCSPFPFVVTGFGKLFTGRVGETHNDVKKRIAKAYPRWREGADDDLIEGRIFYNKYITLWDWTDLDSPELVNKFKQIYSLYKIRGKDISNLIALFERDDVVYAITVRDFIAGKKPLPYFDFLAQENNKTDYYSEFKPSDGTDDNEGERLRRKAIWNGYDRNVAESKKAKKLLESKIRKLIEQAMKNPQE